MFKKTYGLFLVLGVTFLLSTESAFANRQIVVDFTEATLKMYDGYGVEILTTKVVLPKEDYYQLPVRGRLNTAELGPTWIPTDEMHKNNPGKYKSFYKPFEKGNAMGRCKLSINYYRQDPGLNYVHIHGNAKVEDLGARESLGCIRVPDNICDFLVDNSQGFVGIHFKK